MVSLRGRERLRFGLGERGRGAWAEQKGACRAVGSAAGVLLSGCSGFVQKLCLFLG